MNQHLIIIQSLQMVYNMYHTFMHIHLFSLKKLQFDVAVTGELEKHSFLWHNETKQINLDILISLLLFYYFLQTV